MQNKKPPSTITDLLAHRVMTADGKQLGHVADLELSPAPEYKITALLYGASAWLHRLHVLHRFAGILRLRVKPGTAAWDDIARIENGVITLKPEYQVPVEIARSLRL